MIRARGNRYIVEFWDTDTQRKVQVRPKDYGMETPRFYKDAKTLERLAWAAHNKRGRTVAEYAERFCTRDYDLNGRPITDQTNKHNRGRIKAFIDIHGDTPIGDITVEQAIDFADAHENRLREVKAMFNSAFAEDIIDRNPFRSVKPRQRKGSKQQAWLRKSEVDALAGASLMVHGDYGPQFRAMILFAAWTGLRPGEVAGAKWEHLDLEAAKYDVRGQWHSGLNCYAPPKWDSYGLVHVFRPGLEAVSKLERDGEYIFRTKRGGMFYKSQLNRYLEPVRHMAGVPEITFKAFRHFLASYMLNELGLAPYTIAQQLRHSDGGELVISTYGHAVRELHLDRIAEAENAGAAPPKTDGTIGWF